MGTSLSFQDLTSVFRTTEYRSATGLGKGGGQVVAFSKRQCLDPPCDFHILPRPFPAFFLLDGPVGEVGDRKYLDRVQDRPTVPAQSAAHEFRIRPVGRTVRVLAIVAAHGNKAFEPDPLVHLRPLRGYDLSHRRTQPKRLLPEVIEVPLERLKGHFGRDTLRRSFGVIHCLWWFRPAVAFQGSISRPGLCTAPPGVFSLGSPGSSWKELHPL